MSTRSVFAINFKGKEYEEEYEIVGRVIRVYFDGRRKATYVGSFRSHPEALARSLLLDLVCRADNRCTVENLACAKTLPFVECNNGAMPVGMGILCGRCRTVYFVSGLGNSAHIHYDRNRGDFMLTCVLPNRTSHAPLPVESSSQLLRVL